MTLKQALTHNLLNIPGWRTKRHIVVIESDDWGSIRMPSREVYEQLLKEGYRVDKNAYERNDSLAREDDLNALFEVLSKYKDKNGNHPVITANCAVANPDFERIKDDGFRNYYFEPFTTTLQRYQGCENSFELWKQGLDEGLFKPQFHAREHLNVARWMHDLQHDLNDARHVFDYGIMGLFPKGDDVSNNYQVALDDSVYKMQSLDEIVKEGLSMFETLFGYESKTFIAPCYTWTPKLEKTLFENGVVGIQGMVYQKNPGQKRIRHWNGSRNQYGQVYTVRNASFEPTKKIGINECLNRILYAFRWGKPVVISSHRINYIGAIFENNRTNNLKMLNDLLNQILSRWPDVEFMSSDQLVGCILNK